LKLATARSTPEWTEQWTLFEDQNRFLLEEWIAPARLADFSGKDVLESGCGGGHHTARLAAVAASVTAVDLNTAELAQKRYPDLTNVRWVDADAAAMDLGRQFDVVVCIGVIHHTDDPDRTFANLYAHCRPGGTIVVWTYSLEGNALLRYLVEPARQLFFRHLSRRALVGMASALTLLLYPVVYTVYRLPFLRFLPYYEYFANFRRLSFERNVLNVFDKLNAPQTRLTSRSKCEEWFSAERFEPGSISIRRYAGVSYSLVGVKRGA
jgi:SAM-dependent methyltransferase